MLRVVGADRKRDAEELWRRIAFSILITNTDDHLHNHGFLHVSRGHGGLAPAFDINPFPERARELKTWISEDAGPMASVDALMSVAAYFQIPMSRARAVLLAKSRPPSPALANAGKGPRDDESGARRFPRCLRARSARGAHERSSEGASGGRLIALRSRDTAGDSFLERIRGSSVGQVIGQVCPKSIGSPRSNGRQLSTDWDRISGARLFAA